MIRLDSLPTRAARSLAVSMLSLALLAAAVPPPHAPSHDDDHTEAPVALASPQTAGVEIQALWSWIAVAWSALRGQQEICQDCNRPVNSGCRCMCYSGGYDTSDPDC